MRKIDIYDKLHFVRRSIYQAKKKKRLGKEKNSYTQLTREITRLIAPETFLLQSEYCDAVVEFVEKVKINLRKKTSLYIDIRETKSAGEGAISMLLSVLSEYKDNHITVKGNLPRNEDARNILEKTDYHKFVRIGTKTKKTYKNKFLKTGDESTPQSQIKDYVRDSNLTVWGNEGRNQILYGCVFEMMRNSVDHAFKTTSNTKWHWSCSHDEEQKRVKFSFVDNGRGIINTFKNTGLNRVIHLFKDDVDLLQTAFNDGIKSRTGLSWRGKGLPTIYEAYNDNYIKNLVVITNNVFLDFDKQVFKEISVNFSGTFYFWIIDTSCVKACFN